MIVRVFTGKVMLRNVKEWRGGGKRIIRFLLGSLLLTGLSGCEGEKREVVIYTSVDQPFASPLLKHISQETGISIKALYDTEAAKSVGLANRIIAEGNHSRADLFWSSENLRCIQLERRGLILLQPDQTVKNPGWVSKKRGCFSVGGRYRVFVVNTREMNRSEYPGNLWEMTNPKYRGKIAISNPFFGTTADHFAALYLRWGEEKYITFLKGLKKNRIALLGGNSVVAREVGRGRYLFGLVDSDDVLAARRQGFPVRSLYYGQREGEQGVFFLYGTVGILKQSSHQKASREVFDILRSPETEKELIRMGAVQVSVLNRQKRGKLSPRYWRVSPEAAEAALRRSSELIRSYLE